MITPQRESQAGCISTDPKRSVERQSHEPERSIEPVSRRHASKPEPITTRGPISEHPRASLEGVPIHEIDETRNVTRTVHTNIRGCDDSDDSDNSICDWSYMFIPQPCYDYIQPHEDDEYDTDEYDIDKSEVALDHRTDDEERDPPMRD